MVLVGEVTGRPAILIDDMADTCGTLCKAAQILLEHNCSIVYALVVHGIFSGGADTLQRIEQSGIAEIVVTNTVPQGEHRQIVCCDVSAIFAEAIRRMHNGESLSYLFQHLPND